MRIQNLLVRTFAGCLLLGASGAAMAVDCPNGSINGGEVDEIVVGAFQDCLIVNVVAGRVVVIGARHVTVIDSEINGNVWLQNNSTVLFVNNVISDGYLAAKGNAYAGIANNVVRGGSLWVVSNVNSTAVVGNQVNGEMQVNYNNRVDVIDNIASSNITCLNNSGLDSFMNTAQGILNCSAAVGQPTRTLNVETEVGGTVTSNFPGLQQCNSGSTCQAQVPVGTVVMLTATPNPGNVFDDWDGCDQETESPSGGTCTKTIAASTANNIRAEFDPSP